MNLLKLHDGAIAGSSVQVHPPAGAAYLGLRPEAVQWAAQHADAVPATVIGQEYLGADVVLRCQVGSEAITVRAPGHQQAPMGSNAPLLWQSQDMHFFNASGQRLG